MYLDYYRIKVDEFLKPKPSSDPLAKNTGYGWGWLFLLGYIGWGLEKAQGSSSSIIILELILFPFILIAYFLVRKRLIEKRKYGNSLWMASFIAGLIALFIGAGLIFLIGLLFA